MTTSHIVGLFALESIGGVLFGLGLGFVGFLMLHGRQLSS